METDPSDHYHGCDFGHLGIGRHFLYAFLIYPGSVMIEECGLKEWTVGDYFPRRIEYLVVHCSATRVNVPFTEKQLLACHLARGFKGIGYHFYITKDGVLHETRPMSEIGAHALGFNLHSIAVCYEGGLDETGKPADTRTPRQRETLRRVLGELKGLFPQSRIVGHYQLSADVHKVCPVFDARKEYEDL